MKHLSDEALLDLAEGAIASHPHLDACHACRNRVDRLRLTIGAVRHDRIPEPSPLFWNHFSDRISRALQEAPSVSPSSIQPGQWGWIGAALAAFIVAVLILKPGLRFSERAPVTAAVQDGADSPRSTGDAGWTATVPDDSWDIVEGAAGDLDLDAAIDAGIFVRAGSLDRELLMLSDQERRELARVIQLELQRSPS